MLSQFTVLIKWAVLLPVLLLAALFAVANDHVVQFRFNPLDSADSASQIELPLYQIVMAAFVIGALCGAFTAWNRQRKYRRKARVQSGEAAKWQARAEQAGDVPRSPSATLLPGPDMR
jgi:uncharacterized integral membrane protein